MHPLKILLSLQLLKKYHLRNMFQILTLAAVVSTAAATLYSDDSTHQKFLWESFKRDYRKDYATMDLEKQRFAIFIDNLKLADVRNDAELKNGGTAVHGITKFTDLSQAEFESTFLTADAKLNSGDRDIVKINKVPDLSSGLVDWAGKLTTPVKDQGYCGSCWAFSATEQIESDAMRTLGVTYLLSPEQITQCDRTSFGCGGGWTESAYKYVQNTGGLELEADYPYTSYNGVTGSCSSTASKFKVIVSGFKTLSSESDMASYVQTTGPLSVCIDANNWNSYTGGILSVCGTSVDHCVQAVGVDASSYWKVRNSWGTGWGESGYIRLAYGQNTCAITNDPTYASVVLK